MVKGSTAQAIMNALKASDSSATKSGISSVFASPGMAMVTVVPYLPWVVDQPVGLLLLVRRHSCHHIAKNSSDLRHMRATLKLTLGLV